MFLTIKCSFCKYINKIYYIYIFSKYSNKIKIFLFIYNIHYLPNTKYYTLPSILYSYWGGYKMVK